MILTQNRPHGRIRLEETPDGTRITMRGRLPWISSLFLLLWLVPWFLGEMFAVVFLFSPDTPAPARIFLLFWLCLWTVGGLSALHHLLRGLCGSDVLLLGREARMGHRLLGLERLRMVDMDALRQLRVIRGFGRSEFVHLLAPDKGMKPTQIGMGLSAGEADQVVALVQEWLERSDRLSGRTAREPRTGGGRAAPPVAADGAAAEERVVVTAGRSAPAVSSNQRYLFYRPMDLSLTRRREHADAERERTVGGRVEGGEG
jgi:hypothetical protein